MIDRVQGLATAGVREGVLDPYFVLAKRTNFVDYCPPETQTLETYAVSVQVDDRGKQLPDGLTIRTAYGDSKYFTATATAEAYDKLLVDKNVTRVQFAQPLSAPRAVASSRTALPTTPMQSATTMSTPASDILLGIVDNGCPFAHQSLRTGSSTRVLSLWNQDQEVCPAGLGTVPAGFGYGYEFSRTELDKFLAAAIDPSGSVDEDLCYRLMGYEQVFRRRTHAAHSLGLLAASPRPSFSLKGFTARAESPLADSDIVFVQLPQTLMDCISVAALEHHAIDGFRHILEIAKKDGYKKVVVSFGYESWVGPHDGSSWFEEALASLVTEAETAHINLTFFFAAGNSRNRQSHAALKAKTGSTSLRWHVPPGNEVPTFLEIWVPKAEADLALEVTPPGQSTLPKLQWGESLLAPATGRPAVGIVMHRSAVLGAGAHVILIRVSPTHAWDSAKEAAPHGIWTVKLEGIRDQNSVIHAHLGRVEGDPNSPHRAHQPLFLGRSQAQDHSDRAQTLNGHACGAGSKVCGVYYSDDFPYRTVPDGRGGVTAARRRPADYSGAGPTGHRPRPDVSLPMEDGLYHEGTLSIGTRSASVWRMKGTSTAAPAAARLFVQGVLDLRAPRGPGGAMATGNLALGGILFPPRVRK